MDGISQSRASFLKKYEKSVDWVIKTFSRLSAVELELISTIVFADHEASRSKAFVPSEALAKRVHKIKPHFNLEYVQQWIKFAKSNQLLRATNQRRPKI